MNIAIILAGGKGLRMNMVTPKQFLDIDEKPLIIHTLEKFEHCSDIDAILVVCLTEYFDYLRELCKRYSINKLRWIAQNGNSRFESVISGVKCLSENNIPENSKIVIHNANMPFVSTENISECLKKIEDGYDVVATVSKCQEYLFVVNKSSEPLIGPDRNDTLFIKTPEAITFKNCLELYGSNDFYNESYSSFTAAMLGVMKSMKVGYVECGSSNIKLTTEDDWLIMNAMMKNLKGN